MTTQKPDKKSLAWLPERIRWVMNGQDAMAATLQTLVTKVLVLLINVATGVLVARMLGPDGRGEQAAIGMWPQFLTYVMTLGLPTALIYHLKLDPENESELFSVSLMLGAALSAVVVLVGVLFIPSWLVNYSPQVIQMAQVLMFTALLGLPSLMFVGALEVKGEFSTTNQMRYVTSLITLVLLVILALTKFLNPFTSTLAYFIPNTLSFFWLAGKLRSKLQFRLQLQWHKFKTLSQRLLSYGLRSYGVDLLGTLSTKLDQVLVVGFLSPKMMGLYVVSLSLTGMLGVFYDSVLTVLSPKTAARPMEEVLVITGQAVRISSVLNVTAGLAMAFLGPFALNLFYGDKYLGATTVLQILVVDAVLASTTRLLAQVFLALGRPGMVTIFEGAALAMSVPLLIVLVPTYGLVGAGLALCGATVARLTCILLSFPLVLKAKPPSLIPTVEDFVLLGQRLKLKKA
jgi:O-antigen/teichoic acid export membrane protein